MLERTALITLCGLHGSGKTSLSKRIQHEFRSRGIECKAVYLGGWHTFEYAKFPIAAALKLIGLDEKDKRIHRVMSSVLPWIFLLQYYWYFLYKTRGVLFWRKKHFLYITDRYIIDCLVELSVLTDNRNFYKTFVGKCLLSFPRPDISFYLDIPESLVFTRKTDEFHKLSDLAVRRQLYIYLAHQQGINMIDASTSSLKFLKQLLIKRIETCLEI